MYEPFYNIATKNLQRSAEENVRRSQSSMCRFKSISTVERLCFVPCFSQVRSAFCLIDAKKTLFVNFVHCVVSIFRLHNKKSKPHL